ncbi:MAG TPA: cell division protein SepF [Mycobacteriales bacterium]|jgi:cell division inhibitor SepF|nr:cell division protein SepF [Mycobacteriales bacterium]
MGAWRKAGVWLGLVEEDDRRYVDDELDAFDEDYDEPVHRSRTERLAERPERSYERPAPERFPARDRGPVRTFARGAATVAATTPAVGSVGITHDNLALAPQVALRERAVMAEEEQRYTITTLHPTTYNEARTIGEHFREGVPVIMNLTEMDESDAKRLVDFAAGLAFGLRGSIERVTNRVFLLSPANVSVTAEDKAKIAEGGFFNQS